MTENNGNQIETLFVYYHKAPTKIPTNKRKAQTTIQNRIIKSTHINIMGVLPIAYCMVEDAAQNSPRNPKPLPAGSKPQRSRSPRRRRIR